MDRKYIYVVTLVVVVIIVVAGAYWWFSSQPVPLNDIMDNAEDSTALSTLVTALNTANLDDTLRGSGPFTVFAPRNVAFDALPSGVLNELLEDTTALTEVLTYHVVSGKYMASDLATLSTLTTLQGDNLNITVVDSTVKINGESIATEIEASNGVIHVIDTVLVPEGALDIVLTAQYTGSFSTLITALEVANLVDTLKGSGPFTVFAPTEDAFNALPAGVLDDLLANTTALTEVLTYHVVSGKYIASDLTVLYGSSLVTVQGGNLTISYSSYYPNIEVNEAFVQQIDIECSNGVIHVINEVLIP